MIREGFQEKVTLEQRPEGGESTSYAYERKFQARTTLNPKALR